MAEAMENEETAERIEAQNRQTTIRRERASQKILLSVLSSHFATNAPGDYQDSGKQTL